MGGIFTPFFPIFNRQVAKYGKDAKIFKELEHHQSEAEPK
jgi:hypothetical protein